MRNRNTNFFCQYAFIDCVFSKVDFGHGRNPNALYSFDSMNNVECTVIKLNCNSRSMIGMDTDIDGSARQPVYNISSTSHGCACSNYSKCLPVLLISVLSCLALAVSGCCRCCLHTPKFA